jgi:4-amino-4-deoxy-L-arabinose transferase-like glycosyltransferase
VNGESVRLNTLLAFCVLTLALMALVSASLGRHLAAFTCLAFAAFIAVMILLQWSTVG